MTDLFQILAQIQRGDEEAQRQLFLLLYQELRQLAERKIAREGKDSFQATDLVHETYVRLMKVAEPQAWSSKGHFFGAAAKAMRRILVERARKRLAEKRGGRLNKLDVECGDLASPDQDPVLLQLNDALERLANTQPDKVELIELRFFTGLTIEQAAEALQISSATAKRLWRAARAWLLKELDDGKK
jgi:RNA polymerase sigma factor (TIGR02999 family)